MDAQSIVAALDAAVLVLVIVAGSYAAVSSARVISARRAAALSACRTTLSAWRAAYSERLRARRDRIAAPAAAVPLSNASRVR